MTTGLVTLNSKNTEFVLNINVYDDSIIEPFEFFTLEISDVGGSPSLISQVPNRLIIYIEDDDC